MRKYLKLPIALGLLCFSASAQTPEACQAQLRHLTVPEYGPAFSFVPTQNGRAKLPSRLLFSQDGIEVYAATFPDGRDAFLNQISAAGLKVLVVYQEEAVRQAMIKQLLEKHDLPSPGIGAPVDSLKYAKIWFLPEWLPSDLVLGNKMGNPFDRRWSVGHIEYDEPQECLNVPPLSDTYEHSKADHC